MPQNEKSSFGYYNSLSYCVSSVNEVKVKLLSKSTNRPVLKI